MQFSFSNILAALSLTAPAAEVPQSDGVRQVAIIGAGPGGAATAYFLNKYAEQAGVSVNITVFEKTDRIGGRTLTVNAFDNPEYPFELGASIFIKDNHILYNATREFGLPTADPEFHPDATLGIWNGDEFIYQESSWGWWNLAKLFWKYGMAPYKAQNLVKSTVAKFLKLYEEPYFPFESLTDKAVELGLVDLTSTSSAEFLASNDISEQFANDIIQAATRVNYASDLEYIHGLTGMVSMAPEDSMKVVGGNWQIFDKMIEHSNATIYQSTPIASIILKNQTDAAAAPQYYLATQNSKKVVEDPENVETLGDRYPVAFDNVVVATPWQYADIAAGKGVLQETIDEIPYTHLHVTLFSSPYKMSAEYFNVADETQVPESVLTTLNPKDEAQPGAPGVGEAGFYSISVLGFAVNPDTQQEEIIYKVFSAEALSSKFLSKILGQAVPETFISPGPNPKCDTDDEKCDNPKYDPITWYYPHEFNSYPILKPRVTFQEPVLGGGLFYVSGMESFISTMETSALMGKNIARLIANEIEIEVADEEVEADSEDGAIVKLDSDVEVKVDGEEEIAPDEL